jgi:hypothetical protein
VITCEDIAFSRHETLKFYIAHAIEKASLDEAKTVSHSVLFQGVL